MMGSIRFGLLLSLLLALMLPMQAEAAPMFGTAVNYAVGSTPYSVTTGDFNGDGNADMAVANSGSANVSVLLGNGTGGFAAPVNFAAGIAPRSVVSADFNGDGNADLAVANAGSSNVSILLGNGLGGFAAAVNFIAGATPESVISADFNGDGNADLAFANQQAINNVSVLLGNGAGSFSAPIYTTFAPGTSLWSVISADFNGDGNADLAVANSSLSVPNADYVSVLLGNGTGGFAAPVNFGAGLAPRSVASADFNGDGNLDLTVANANGNNVSVLLGNGTGGFAAAVNYGAGTIPTSVTTGDFNGDGNADMAVANQTSNNVSVLLGNGTGGFAAAVNYGAGTTPISVTTDDFNGDGNTDMAVANYSSANVSVFLNQLDTAAPTGTISIDAGNAATNSTAVTLTLTCSDNVGCTQMQFSNDNMTWNALAANATSSAWTLAAGADGVRTVYARFTDAAGNVSAAVSDTITLDTVAPNAPVITAPTGGAISSNTTPAISGTAEANASVAVNDGVTGLGIVSASGTGAWSLTPGALAEGAHSFTAIATDQAGNVGPASAAVAYTVDTTPPVISLNGPANVTVIQGFTYTDAGATALDSLDGVITGSIVTVNPVNTAIPGTYTVTYNVTDTAGNAAVQVTRTVDVVVPVVSITSPLTTDVIVADATGNAQVNVSISTTNFVVGALNAPGTDGHWHVFVDGVDQGAQFTTTSAALSIAAGTHTIIAELRDHNHAQLVPNVSTSVSINVLDQTPPAVTAPANISVPATQTDGTPATDAAIAAFLNGASATDNVDGAITPTNDAPAIFPVGTTTVTFSATDAAGNTGTATATVTVTAPLTPLISLSLNSAAFRTNNTMTVTASTLASNPPTNADVYVALQLPDGTLLVMQPDGSFGTTLTPLLSNVSVPDFTGPIFNFTFSGTEPPGNYTWFAALMQLGTMNVIGTLAVVPISFAP